MLVLLIFSSLFLGGEDVDDSSSVSSSVSFFSSGSSGSFVSSISSFSSVSSNSTKSSISLRWSSCSLPVRSDFCSPPLDAVATVTSPPVHLPPSYMLHVLLHAVPNSVTGCSAVPQFLSFLSVFPSLSLYSHSHVVRFERWLEKWPWLSWQALKTFELTWPSLSVIPSKAPASVEVPGSAQPL